MSSYCYICVLILFFFLHNSVLKAFKKTIDQGLDKLIIYDAQNVRQHTSAYVSICQHTSYSMSAYVSIRQQGLDKSSSFTTRRTERAAHLRPN